MVLFIYNLVLLAVQTASGSQGPPTPGGEATRGPQTPIDENIWILLIVAILFGIYIIYKRNSKVTNKAS